MSKPRLAITHLAGQGGQTSCCGRALGELNQDDKIAGTAALVTCVEHHRLMVVRFYCPAASAAGSGLQHDSGSGQLPRKRCRGCGTVLAVKFGLYGLFPWRGDGRYRAGDAHQLLRSEAKAEAKVAAWNEQHKPGAEAGGWVVRWVPATELDK
jgi:hypothetical protein